MLTGLTIENLRGIRSLSIDDFGRINIFVGANGSGKTTILEAILMASLPTDPAALHKLSDWREFPAPAPGNDAVFSTLFHQANTNSTPKIIFRKYIPESIP